MISITCVGVLLARALPINMPNRNARRCSGGFMSLILVFARKWVGGYRLLRYRKAFSFADSIRFGLWLARGCRGQDRLRNTALFSDEVGAVHQTFAGSV